MQEGAYGVSVHEITQARPYRVTFALCCLPTTILYNPQVAIYNISLLQISLVDTRLSTVSPRQAILFEQGDGEDFAICFALSVRNPWT